LKGALNLPVDYISCISCTQENFLPIRLYQHFYYQYPIQNIWNYCVLEYIITR